MSRLVDEIVTVDFETEAIDGALPPKPVGVSIRPPGGGAYYMAWGHNSDNNCTQEDARITLRHLFKYYPILCHNAAFDINVAKYHLNIPYPDEIHDTMFLLFLRNPHAFTLSLKPSAEEILHIPPTERDVVVDWIMTNVPGVTSRKKAPAYISLAPAALVGPYAEADTEMTYALFSVLYDQYSGEAYDRELKLLKILANNTLEGIRLNLLKLFTDFVAYTKVRKDVEQKIFTILGCEFNLNSGEELANAIVKSGLDANWILTKSGKRSTSKGNLLAAVQHPELLGLLSYRGTLTTYLDTFMMPWINKEHNGILHFSWNQVKNSEHGGLTGTRSGRLSSTPSMLNVPVNLRADIVEGHMKLGLPPLPRMKTYLLPDDGHIWNERDYASQELRVLAHYEDEDMLHSYIENPKLDFHQMLSDMLTRELGHPIIRRKAKDIAFSILYGRGAPALAEALECSVDEAKHLKNLYLQLLPGIVGVQKAIKANWDKGEPITTWGGRNYYKEEAKMMYNRRNKEYYMADFIYKGLNYLIQGSSADVTKQAIINYSEICKNGRFLLSVHDSINISTPLEERYLLNEAMKDIKIDAPMMSDSKIGPSYGDLTAEED